MKNIAGSSSVRVKAGGESLISTSGASLLMQTAAVSGLVAGLLEQLARWRKPLAVHDPAKMILDIAVAIACGGCLGDVALLRAQPELFGPVASDPTISRMFEGHCCVARSGRARDGTVALSDQREARQRIFLLGARAGSLNPSQGLLPDACPAR